MYLFIYLFIYLFNLFIYLFIHLFLKKGIWTDLLIFQTIHGAQTIFDFHKSLLEFW